MLDEHRTPLQKIGNERLAKRSSFLKQFGYEIDGRKRLNCVLQEFRRRSSTDESTH